MKVAKGRDGTLSRNASVTSDVFKSVVCIILIGEVMCSVSCLPQRSTVHFPTTNNAAKFPSTNNNENFFSQNQNQGNNEIAPNVELVPPTEFQTGTTGIACDKPGSFVKAPDGCNRCFCAENRQLSSACSRVYCPPGFPSSSQGQYRV